MTGADPRPEAQASTTVRRPGEVVRLAMATREVLEVLRTDDVNDAARRRANALYDRSVQQLGEVLSDDLRRELTDLAPDLRDGVPSTDELRVVDAQLAGWLDGLLQSMQAAVAAQQHEAQQAQAEAAARAERQSEAALRRHDTTYL